MMQKPLRILIDIYVFMLNEYPIDELCLGLGCQDVTVSVLLPRLKHNGPAVWFVAPASRRKWFLLFRLDEQVLSRQDLIV